MTVRERMKKLLGEAIGTPILMHCKTCKTTVKYTLTGNGSPSEQDSQAVFDLVKAKGGNPGWYWGAKQQRPDMFDITCCGKRMKYNEIHGKYNKNITCNAKCQASRGPNCECQCGGKNHGATYA